MTSFKTPDLCDRFAEDHHLQIAEPLFRCFGGRTAFSGRITTLKVFEDDVLIRTVLEEKADDGVLVIDGGGSHRCALLDGSLGQVAATNGWQGLIVYGCIRDSAEIDTLPLGVRALHTHPLGSHRRGTGDRDCLITFAGVNFRSGYYVYADEDGIVVAANRLV